ncbi:MAG: hypothetical protein JW864_07355 [Spirochaetes bacterium]|nr:hypothetical protein [Spirochaetota bacterium]
MFPGDAFSQSVEAITERAEEYYKQKDFNRAIAEWLSALELDPENEDIQKRIESVYDEKHEKDVSLQIAKVQLKLAKRSLDSNLKASNKKADFAWEKFVVAYRIDPKDPELQILKEEMREFRDILEVENRKKRLSEALKKRYYEILPLAREKMKSKEYEQALQHWKELLSIVPLDKVASEGKRQAELAIQNRLKYERILALLNSGVAYFNQKKYTEAELEFKQVIGLDKDNGEAEDYLDQIKDILEEKRNYELLRLQAERLYTSGIDNVKNKRFDQAEEDFENVLSLIDNYKDTANRLKSLDRLKKEYEEQQKISKLKTIDKEFQNGLIALSDSRYKDAIVALGAVLSLDPVNSLAKKYIQLAKEAQEQLEEEMITRDSPYYGLVNPLIVSGKLLYEKGDYTESRKQWERILDLFPKNRIATEYLLKCNLKINPDTFDDFSRIYVNEGKKLLNQNRYRDALLKFEMIKSISSGYPGIDTLIASAKAGLVKKPKPVNKDISPEQIEDKIASGIEYYRKGGENNLKLALDQFKWITSNDPENTNALIYINKIESQLRVGTTVAQDTAGKLTDRQRKLVRSYYFKGILYYSNEDLNKAIAEFQKVLLIDPKHEKAKNAIRKCLVLLKR